MKKFKVKVLAPSQGYGRTRFDKVIECESFSVDKNAYLFYDNNNKLILAVPIQYTIVEEQ
jgi:hypothetical protein